MRRDVNLVAASCCHACPPASSVSVTLGCSPIARDRRNSPAPVSSWLPWPLPPQLSCRPGGLHPWTQASHSRLPHAAPSVLARTGAGLPASCRNEVPHHEGFSRSCQTTTASIFTTRDSSH